MREATQAYAEAIFDTDRERALRVVHEAVRRGVSPEDVVFEIVVPAIEMALDAGGSRGEISLAQSFVAAQIAAEVTDEMVPRFRGSPAAAGRVVIGTAPGDFHGLGKRIVVGCLKAAMFDVHDLGLSVTPERFVDEAVAREAQVIGISAMMDRTARGEDGCRRVRRLLRERGLEGRIKIAVGGAPFRLDHQLYRAVEADAWAENGIRAGRVVADLVKQVEP
jgi:methylmalonyl-CoA mutase cobalamin-binding domain/chain